MPWTLSSSSSSSSSSYSAETTIRIRGDFPNTVFSSMNTPTDTTTMIYAMKPMKTMMMMRAIATTTRSTPRTVSPRKTRTP